MADLITILTDLQARRKELQSALRGMDAAIAALKGISGPRSRQRLATRRPTLSAAARKRIADAQRARWARVRAQQKKSA
jgi:hypothetical protein